MFRGVTRPVSLSSALLAGCFAVNALHAASPAIEVARREIQRTEYASAVKVLLPLAGSDNEAAVMLGQSYYLSGDYKHAVEILEKATGDNPKNSDAHLWLGRTYGRKAELAFPLAALPLANKTRASLEKAVELNPHNIEAVNDLFEFYLEAPGLVGGGLDKATGLVPLISRNDPAEGHWALARISEQRKQYGPAEMHLRRALEAQPRQAGRLLDLAKFLAKRGRYEESDTTFAQAEKVAPNTPKVLFERANSNIRTKHNVDEARELLKRYIAMNLGPEDPTRNEARKLLRQVSGS
jgi:tetratricopeptide (TPR) repeat protein